MAGAAIGNGIRKAKVLQVLRNCFLKDTIHRPECQRL
jgi:hypothetical protein